MLSCDAGEKNALINISEDADQSHLQLGDRIEQEPVARVDNDGRLRANANTETIARFGQLKVHQNRKALGIAKPVTVIVDSRQAPERRRIHVDAESGRSNPAHYRQ